MKGLILKDLLNIKAQAKILGLMVGVFALIFIPQGNVSFIIGYIALICSMMVITTLSYDHVANWDRYALTMPITRKEMVLSKYVVMLIFSTVGTLIGCIFSIASGFFVKSIGDLETLLTSGMVLCIALIFGSVILPLLYKFGPEKARFLIILVALIPTAIVLVGAQIVKALGIPKPNTDFLNSLVYFIPVIAVVIFVVSYLISLKIYNKKEF